MAGLPWFALYADFPDHPKTVRLAARLRDRNAGMYVIRLLSYCARYASDGVVKCDLVEHASGWVGEPGELLKALREVGFLDEKDESFQVHGWEEKNGAHARKFAADAKKPRGNVGGPAVVPRKSRAEPAGEKYTDNNKDTETTTTAGRLPSKAELLAAKYPATASLLDLLAEQGQYLAHPASRGDELEAALVTLGVEDVARGLLRQLEGRDDIGSLGFFQSKLIAAARRPTKPKTNGHPVTPTADLSWLDRLDESQRPLAEQAWKAKQLEVQSMFRPESVPRVLAEAAEVLRQEFLS